MAAIYDYLIPDDLIVDFEKIIDQIPPATLKTFISTRPGLAKGFRPSHLQVNIIRQRLKSMLRAAGQLDSGLVVLLASESLNLEFIAVLSLGALELVFSHCVSYFGTFFVAAALLDDRQDVRDMAEDYWAAFGNSKPDLLDSQQAAAILQRELEPFLEHIVKLAAVQDGSGVGPVCESAAVDLEAVAKYRQKIAFLESQQAQVKEAKRLNKVLNEKIKGKDAEIEILQHKISREQEIRKSASQQAEKEASELAELQKTFSEKLKATVAGEVSSVVRGWLKRPRQIEKEVLALASKEDLLGRAEEILLRQAAIDRNIGNRKILLERLTGFEDMRDRVQSTAREVLKPAPELREIVDALEDEIIAIQTTLGISKMDNPTLLKMQARIKQASNVKALAQIKKVLFGLAEVELFTAKELSALYSSYQDCQDQLYDRYGSQGDDSCLLHVGGNTIMQLTAEREPFHLILDGHNIILDSEGLFPDVLAEDNAGGEARNWLLMIVDRMLAGSPCQASVFFDGSSPSVRSYSIRVKELFSGGGGVEVKNRADQAIVSYITSLSRSEKSPMPVIVVTNDRELQGLVQEQGAKIMPLAQFAVLTSRYNA